MITVTEAFLNAIRSDNRKCRGKVVLKYSTPITLENEQIQSIEESSSAEISLGTVQNDDLTVKVMPNVLTEEQFNQEIDVEIYIGCDVANVPAYVQIGTYKTNGWDKSKTGVMTIRLTNKIDPTAIIPHNIIAKSGTFLEDYCEELILNVFAENLIVASGVTSQTLKKSWLMYDDITTQLKKMAEACNGLFRYTTGFELVPFKARTPVAILSIGPNEELLEVTRLSDYSKNKQQISVLRSEFSESTNTKLASSSMQTQGGTNTKLELKTGGPVKVTYVVMGNEYGRLNGIIQGVTWCNVLIWDAYGDNKHIVPVEVYGNRVESVLKDTKLVTDGTITYIENPYIQTTEHVATLDKRIYEGIRYKLKYRGNPCYQIGDTIAVENIGNVLIYKRQLNYNGGLIGYMEGVLIDTSGLYWDGTWLLDGTQVFS